MTREYDEKSTLKDIKKTVVRVGIASIVGGVIGTVLLGPAGTVLGSKAGALFGANSNDSSSDYLNI